MNRWAIKHFSDSQCYPLHFCTCNDAIAVNLLNWQFLPVYPLGQVHLYSFVPSTHFPPFWHGIEAHSSISEMMRWKYTYITKEITFTNFFSLKIRVSLRRTLIDVWKHCLSTNYTLKKTKVHVLYPLVSHLMPLNPGWQRQMYILTESKQVPLFRHGLEEHSLISKTGKMCKYMYVEVYFYCEAEI